MDDGAHVGLDLGEGAGSRPVDEVEVDVVPADGMAVLCAAERVSASRMSKEVEDIGLEIGGGCVDALAHPVLDRKP